MMGTRRRRVPIAAMTVSKPRGAHARKRKI